MIDPKRRLDRSLHVSDHGLQTLLADFGKATFFVDHPAFLAAHAQGTSLACVWSAHGLDQFPQPSRLTTFFDRVPDCSKSTAAANFHFLAHLYPYRQESTWDMVTRWTCFG